MERRESSKHMNILGSILEETSSAKKKQPYKESNNKVYTNLKKVDRGWLKRCSTHDFNLTSEESSEDEVHPNHVQPSESMFSPPRRQPMASPSKKSKVSKALFLNSPACNTRSRTKSGEQDFTTEADSGVLTDQFSSPFTFSIDDLQDAIIETQQELTSTRSSSNGSINPSLVPLGELAQDIDSNSSIVESENSRKRSLEPTTPDVNDTESSNADPGPQRKFFKTRMYMPERKYTYPLSFYKPPSKNTKKKSPGSSSKKKKSGSKKTTEASVETPVRNKKVAVPNKNSYDFDFQPLESEDEDHEDEEVVVKKKKKGRPKKTGGKPKKEPAKKSVTSKKKSAVPSRRITRSTDTTAKTKKVTGSIVDEGVSTESKLTAVYDDYDEIVNQTGDGNKKRNSRKGRGGELRRSLKNMNDNYVRIDIDKKKKFIHGGKKKITGAQMKRTDWKFKKSLASREAKLKTSKCHKCGEFGHYAMYCLKDMIDKDLIPDNTENSPLPTLEEAARMVWSAKAISSSKFVNKTSVYETINKENHESETSGELDVSGANTSTGSLTNISFDDDMSSVAAPKVFSEQFVLAKSNVQSVDPILDKNSSGVEKLLMDGLKKFNFTSFRPGQQEAITRVLQGLSTLLVLGTGSGKSLCYQLPAYLYAQEYPGVLSLCVSPLVSLMEDQLKHVPSFLRVACLHTQMTTRQKELVLEKVRNRKLDILLVSPEAICTGLFGLLRNVEQFPPVAFACIDEVHCVSEWSHNFRPSYLKLCKVLREKLNVHTILGLTATATNYTTASVCEHLNVDPSSRIQGEILPPNLNLTISRDIERDYALIELLHGDRFSTCDSIIIYCTKRNECDRVAKMVRTCLQPLSIGEVKSNSNLCEVYHAGLRGSLRRKVQADFMSGKTRIVVATVAFGMGINKSNIRAIIHYNMPKTFESYVQEIGRAGRDGGKAECHLFLDSSRGKDLSELKRHIYSNYIDRSTLRNLTRKIFKPCTCTKVEKLKGIVKTDKKGKIMKHKCQGHEVSFSVEQTTLDLDLYDENIETLLCYLELDTKRKWIEILPKCYQFCKIQTYGGSKLLHAKALTCPPLAAAIALQKENKKFKEGSTYLEFNLVELAATLDWNSAVVRRELKSLEWTATQFDNDGKPTSYRKSGLLVEFSDLAYRMIVPGDLTDDDFDYLLDSLQKRCVEQEKTQLYQLEKIHQAFQSVSTPNILSVCDSFDASKSDKLKSFVREYFGQTKIHIPLDWKPESFSNPALDAAIRQDVLNLLGNNRETHFTGRAVAKLFQGIGSPCFPPEVWNRNRTVWRKHLDAEFHSIVRIASEEIVHWQ